MNMTQKIPHGPSDMPITTYHKLSIAEHFIREMARVGGLPPFMQL